MAKAEYYARIHRVLDHVEGHLDQELSLESLAEVGCFSPYHFHRVFGAVVGEPLMSFVTRLRLEKAAKLLVHEQATPVSRIAERVGMPDSSVFARAFRRQFGVSASAWRVGKRPPDANRKQGKMDRKQSQDFDELADHLDGTHSNRRFPMPDQEVKVQVEVRDAAPRAFAYVRHIGPYAGDAELFGRLFGKVFAWAGPRGLLGPEARPLTIYHDDPEVTPTEKLRISVGITVPAGTAVEGEIGTMDIPGGKYAVATCAIHPGQYLAAWNALMVGWFPSSGWQPDERPCFELHLNDPAQDPEGYHRLELWEPVRPL
ncbi:MAG TPA: AraC family transcriptional regulator [Fibrobacteria bacterium]|nr:AraC family transcriptional regulator [Fibrobacteria bacterium]HOX50732.1 AraC family transcriptional regulator [Fibrobacteria bacterium]